MWRFIFVNRFNLLVFCTNDMKDRNHMTVMCHLYDFISICVSCWISFFYSSPFAWMKKKTSKWITQGIYLEFNIETLWNSYIMQYAECGAASRVLVHVRFWWARVKWVVINPRAKYDGDSTKNIYTKYARSSGGDDEDDNGDRDGNVNGVRKDDKHPFIWFDSLHSKFMIRMAIMWM